MTRLDLPIHLRVSIFNYTEGQTQDELINLIVVSKQICNDCIKQPGIKWKIIPTIEISLSTI